MGAISLPTTAPSSTPRPGAGIDYELFLDCVHCGLCTSACPTYLELGTEMDSPRGRIYLMRGVVDGRLPLDDAVRGHLELCLDCRACESACPSGVQYGALIEPFRVDLEKRGEGSTSLAAWQRFMLFQVMTSARLARWALAPARLLQMLRLDRLVAKVLPRRLRGMQEMLPKLTRYRRLPERLPAEGPRRAKVAFMTGCVNDAMFNGTNWATAKVLQKNGCDVWIPRAQACCGALDYHAGRAAPARRYARKNCTTFLNEEVDAIIVNVAGCGALLKEYDHLLAGTPDAEAGRKFKAKVKDISEFLMELGPIRPTHALRLRATYHDACHLCHAQRIRQAPRDLLALIPGLQMQPLAESEVCCGAAGSYNLTEPEMAERLGARKTRHILNTRPDAVFTANAGCLLQIAKHLRAEDSSIWVAHPVEALWASYSGIRTGELSRQR